MVASRVWIKVAEQVVDAAIEQEWLDKLIYAFSQKRRIILLGSTGVGKTNLLNSLKKFPPIAISYIHRTVHTSSQDLQINKRKFTLIDTPGDIGYSQARTQTLRENITRGKVGIINVVAYGYHEYGIDPRSAFGGDDQPLPEYLERHRQIEIDSLRETLPLFGNRDYCDFFLTVVTKCDLWWNERQNVIPYYTLGYYAKELSSYDIPPPMVVDYCSVLHQFYGRGPIFAHFDEEIRLIKRQQFFATMIDVLSRG